MKMHCILPMTILAAFISGCSLSPHSGGTTDTGNAKVAVVVYAPDGSRAAGAAVTVCPAEYYSGVGADSSARRLQFVQKTVTDDTGFFRIDSIENGKWSIEVNDGYSSSVLLRVDLGSDGDSAVIIDTTLYPYAYIAGNVGAVNDTAIERYLVINGLDRRIVVDRKGGFSDSALPAGTFTCRIVSSSSSWSPLEFDSVILLPDSTAQVSRVFSADTTRIIINTTSSGAGVMEDVYEFPVLVRLSEENFDFDKAQSDGNDVRCIRNDGTALPFEIEQWDSVQQKACIWVRIDTIHGNDDRQFFMMLCGDFAAALPRNNNAVFDTATGFLGSYHLGASLKNAAVNNYHGVDSGSVDTASGIIGRARAFNGKSQFFSITGLPDRQSGMLSCWFRPKTTVNPSMQVTQGIWGKKNGENHDYTLSLQGADYWSGTGSPGKLIAKFEDTYISGYYFASDRDTFEAGVWYYAALAWGNGSGYLYVNGELEDSVENSAPLSGLAIEEVGRCSYDPSNISTGDPLYFKGTVDEFRIDQTYRSAAWVRLCYMNQRTDGLMLTVGNKE